MDLREDFYSDRFFNNYTSFSMIGRVYNNSQPESNSKTGEGGDGRGMILPNMAQAGINLAKRPLIFPRVEGDLGIHVDMGGLDLTEDLARLKRSREEHESGEKK